MTQEQQRKLASPVETFIFIRADGFYPLELPCETVADNAECNPGTLRVENIKGEVVWTPPTNQEPATP